MMKIRLQHDYDEKMNKFSMNIIKNNERFDYFIADPNVSRI